MDMEFAHPDSASAGDLRELKGNIIIKLKHFRARFGMLTNVAMRNPHCRMQNAEHGKMGNIHAGCGTLNA